MKPQNLSSKLIVCLAVYLLNVIPFVDPAVGVLVFAAASLLKDTVNRIGDLVDDGLPNSSFKS